MELQDLKDKTTLHLTNRLMEIAPAVLEAHAAYNALAREQRLLTTARELLTDGIWIGDHVRTDETGKMEFLITLDGVGHPQLQPLRNGKPNGSPLFLWQVGRVERIDTATP
ncbi:hypothetical protein [Hymenobacter lapidiphilus]|uniref:Uncharacterized protein n=1 Tax=Hymenobacter lapidiphilus TaxID=2608003 RepID=A0A7Y7PT28_9BACT|nr:hypothetical protein [Hymenobacter lapidiphilus]NVO33550.1 hypothetical protein [Hymenobacter lapidiphilus]